MANVRVTVSIPKGLFDRAEAMAKKMGISRSRLFALALEDLFTRYSEEEILKRVKEAYVDYPDPAESAWLRFAPRHHGRLAEGDA